MKKIYYPQLPPLPAELEQEIVTAANSLAPDESGRQWVEQFHDNQIRAVSHVYGRGHTILSEHFQQELQRIYGPYFDNERLVGIVGKLENTYGSGLAESPPHCDRFRHFAVNYLLQSGGTNVLTCFYNEHRVGTDLTEAENGRYNNLTLDFKVCIPERIWHAYDVQYYHSVENIENARLMFSLVLASNPDFDTFKKNYKNILE